ncbi:hypothetical protein ABGV49_08235 [Chromobacterium vaccinii]|uniref:Uncharacterized protein n=1 Tax=Chromobacterium vaccinii TaxID=1108595 RepID=A0ABV0FAC3_9NEIS
MQANGNVAGLSWGRLGRSRLVMVFRGEKSAWAVLSWQDLGMVYVLLLQIEFGSFNALVGLHLASPNA